MSSDQRVSINFVCQRCSQPIRLDHDFFSLDEHTLAELSLPINPAEDPNLEAQVSNLSKLIRPFRLTESGNGANGFTLVGETGETEQLSHGMKRTAELFDLLSNNSEIDHPLCEDCSDQLLSLMDHQLKLAEEECNDYRTFLNKLESDPDTEDIESLEKELAELELEEQSLKRDLDELDSRQVSVQSQLESERQEHERLQQEEDRFWRQYVKYKRELLQAEDNYRSVECQLRYTQTQLDKLKKTNVFNTTFNIWHSNHFGTINNFRLGRLPAVPVDWAEINAAWGQTVLLLWSLARKLNLTFKRYRLVPYGNHSYIEVLADHTELPLYGSGGIRFLFNTKFDDGMVAFLDCMQQFKDHVEKGDSNFCLPYPMEKGKIRDTVSGTPYSVKIQFNSMDHWTKALKFLLINLKWGLTWVSSQFSNSETDTSPT